MLTLKRLLYFSPLVASVLIGLAWILKNRSHVAQYGDTVEYLELAQSFNATAQHLTLSQNFKIDQYRTVLYPLFLHLTGLHFDSDSPIYAFVIQFALLVVSSAIFAFAFARDISISKQFKVPAWIVVAITTILTSTSPLPAHFSLSLMSDSVAGSLTVATVGALIHTLLDYRSGQLRWSWVILSGAFLFLMTLSRVDKLYLGIALALTAVVCLYRMGASLGRARIMRDGGFVGIVLCLSLASTIVTNHLTQTYNPSRPPLNASCLLFNRVVWPRLERVYPYLPEDARALISQPQAKQFDADANQVYLLMGRILNESPDGKHVVNEITRETLQRFPGAVIGKTAFDIGKYSLPVLSFPLELTSVLPKSDWTSWTYSRMRMFSPKLTRFCLVLSFACLLLLQLPLALRQAANIHWKNWLAMPTVQLTTVAIIVNALLFGLEAGMDAHIRYALPTFLLEFEVITMLGLLRMLPARKSTESMPIF